MKEFGFPASEKLKGKKDINRLFQEGRWKTAGPLRIIYLKDTTEVKVGVSVSKKYFKHAVDRNRVKRLLRETYRLDKARLHEFLGETFHCMLFWVSKELPQNLAEVQEKYRELCLPKNQPKSDLPSNSGMAK